MGCLSWVGFLMWTLVITLFVTGAAPVHKTDLYMTEAQCVQAKEKAVAVRLKDGEGIVAACRQKV